MPEFVNEHPRCRFTIPDRPTVRQQLAYNAIVFSGNEELPSIELQWQGALSMIDEWECELLPDPHVDLDTVDNPGIVKVIYWAVPLVTLHVVGLEDVPKN